MLSGIILYILRVFPLMYLQFNVSRKSSKQKVHYIYATSSHSATFKFSLLTHLLQMLLGSKINFQANSYIYPVLQVKMEHGL